MSQSYEPIDAIISEWTQRHDFTLFTHTAGFSDTFRCVYLSSSSGECCQICIDAPTETSVSVRAAEVESRGNEEMRANWVVPISELGHALENAIAHVHQWFARPTDGVRA